MGSAMSYIWETFLPDLYKWLMSWKVTDKKVEVIRSPTGTRERIAEFEKLALKGKEATHLRKRTSTSMLAKPADTSALKENEVVPLDKTTSTVSEVDAIDEDKKFENRQKEMRRILDARKNIDVAFLVDCTESMISYIEATKNDIKGIVSTIELKYLNKIRLAFVGYRDHSDGTKRIESLDFTENIEEFKTFVGNISATGAGDIPEDVFGGLEATINLSWSSPNKYIFHTGDAPQHGSRFHNLPSSSDHYYETEPRGLHVEDLLECIKTNKLKYFFGKINDSTDKMIVEFQRVGGSDVVQLTELKTANMLCDSLINTIDLTISETIVETMSTFKCKRYSSNRSLKEYTIHEIQSDLTSIPKQNVKWLACKIPPLSDLRRLKQHLETIQHVWKSTTVQKVDDPFAEGAQRISYHGLRMVSQNVAPIRYNESIVLKEFKYFGEDRREDYIEIMETQAVAGFMVKEFNKVAPSGARNITFLEVNVVEIDTPDGCQQYYNVEPVLPDYDHKFKKWNNNCGYVNDDDYSLTLDAFSHWTYDITDGFLIVVDLQGVDRYDEYILTDPSISCLENRFGSANLGLVGMEEFFQTHSCGSICEAMSLKKNELMRSVPQRTSVANTILAF